MTTASDENPPPFTAKQGRTIRRIGRRSGYPRNELEDLAQIVWIEVKRCWARVPRVEPDFSKYVFRMAHNLAIAIVKKMQEDAMTHAVNFSGVDEAKAQGVSPAMPAKVSPEDKVLAQRVAERAVERDPEAADWMMRTKVHDESFVSVAEDVGQPEERVKKRVNRLVVWLRKNMITASMLVTLLWVLLIAVFPAAFGGHDRTTPDDTNDFPRDVTPRQRPVVLRSRAFAACNAEQWDECRELLDEAKALDPNGESDARVQKARTDIEEAELPPPPPPGPPPSEKKL